MNKKVKRILPVFISFFIFQSFAYPGAIINFTAEINQKEQGQKNKSDFVQYIVPLASRLEMKIPIIDKTKESQRIQEAVIITRLDKKVFWMLMPAQKTYCEFTFKDLRKSIESGRALTPSSGQGAPTGYTYKRVKGSKKILGYKAFKYRVFGKNFEGYAWFAKNKKFRSILKYLRNQANTMDEANISSGGPPAGYIVLEQNGVFSGMEHQVKVKSIRFKRMSSSTFEIPEDFEMADPNLWKNYQANFDTKRIIEKMKEGLKNAVKEKIKEEGRGAAKKAIKGLFGF